MTTIGTMSLERLIHEAIQRELNSSMVTHSPLRAIEQSEEKPTIKLGISARHLHVTKEHLEALFGVGYELTVRKVLMGGQFAAEERVTLVGSNLQVIENVRILGPVRSATQVELSKTDARKLSLNAPIRESGDLKDSMPITLVGPKGAIRLDQGCIVAMRHIHMSPRDAQRFGVSDRDIVSVKTAEGARKGVLSNVLIRVHESYDLEMHIDIDEANAFQLEQGDLVTIL